MSIAVGDGAQAAIVVGVFHQGAVLVVVNPCDAVILVVVVNYMPLVIAHLTQVQLGIVGKLCFNAIGVNPFQ